MIGRPTAFGPGQQDTDLVDQEVAQLDLTGTTENPGGVRR